jgi:hypothetical protein
MLKKHAKMFNIGIDKHSTQYNSALDAESRKYFFFKQINDEKK